VLPRPPPRPAGPVYLPLPLSFAASPRLWREVSDFRPDVVHCSSPGVMAFAAYVYSAMLRAPLVLSYHTHVPAYLPRYGIQVLAPLFWGILKYFHSRAMMTLCTSAVMKEELDRAGATGGRPNVVWRRGVDADIFHPKYQSPGASGRFAFWPFCIPPPTRTHTRRPLPPEGGSLGHPRAPWGSP